MKQKNLMLILLLFSCSSSKINNDSSKIEVNNPTLIEDNSWTAKNSAKKNYNNSAVHLDWSESSFLKPYIDSILKIKNNDFPKFLLNDCFDYDNSFYWGKLHNPKSFRRKLIYSINDIKVLELLLENKNKISNNICTENLEHPYGGNSSSIDSQNLTNLQLVKLRLKELEN